MTFADLHTHSLWGVDDGARKREDMQRMLDAAYEDGTRYICFTPHFHLGYFGDNKRKTEDAFFEVSEYASVEYPDMKLCLGNELRYSPECVFWLQDNLCRTMNGTEYVLVDFPERERADTIVDGLHRILNAGYIPVLAHAERYDKLSPGLREIRGFRQDGVLIQLDSQSLTGAFGRLVKWRANAILQKGYADFVSTDAHDLRRRPPVMSDAFEYIKKKTGMSVAQRLCRDNALRLLWPDAEEIEQNGNH